MTMKRETKSKVQAAAMSTEPLKTQSPKARAQHGKFYPAGLARLIRASDERPNRTHGRTRETVVSQKLSARRTSTRRG